MIIIRNETEADYGVVEDVTRRAFYNVYVPGCVEHYLVRAMRGHGDFIPELDFVIELDGRVIGNIMYTRARLAGDDGTEKEILTFGPLSIAPGHQRRGYGKMLMAHSFARARALGYDAVVIFGNPSNYVSSGFVSCKKHNICLDGGRFPAAMLALELIPGALDGRRWVYRESPAVAVDEREARRYDDALEALERERRPSQEAFYILSHSFVE